MKILLAYVLTVPLVFFLIFLGLVIYRWALL